MNRTRVVRVASWGLAIVLMFASAAVAQRLDGDLRGTVKDPTGAVVPGARVTVTSQNTGLSRTVTTTAVGVFQIPNLLPGPYTVTVEASGFRRTVKRDVRVIANRLVEVEMTLEVGPAVETVTVEAGAELVERSTSNLTGITASSELLRSGLTHVGEAPGNTGVINLAVLAPGTTSQPGGVVGIGGAIGGNRPRQNNFVVDGVDNNDPSVTGPLAPVIGDTVAEFTLLTNQFAAEYGHSTAGQFLITTESGSNDLHGGAWWYLQNANLNSFDNLNRTLFEDKPRFDWNRFGGKLGGAVIEDKWFMFGAIEYRNLTLAATPAGTITAPTAGGLAALQSLADTSGTGVSATNVGVLASFVPTAASATGTELVCDESVDPTCSTPALGVPIEVGTIAPAAPNFDREHLFHLNTDVQTPRHRFSGRFNFSRDRFIFPGELPIDVFNSGSIFDTRRITFSDVFTISPNVVNEFRLGYNRATSFYPVGDLPPPGNTSVFPNMGIDEFNLNIGPQSNFPQGGNDNIYNFVDNFSYVKGTHTIKTGVDVRTIISGSDFLPRARGDFVWATDTTGSTPGAVNLSGLDGFVRDTFPTSVSIRGVGSGFFAQNRTAFFVFLQDTWRVHPRVVLDFGVRYEYTEPARDTKLQALNALASVNSVPGDPAFQGLSQLHQETLLRHVVGLAGQEDPLKQGILFRPTKGDVDNWAPRLGLAYDVFGDGKMSIRAGIARGFDVLFGNLPLLQLPPQLQAENREGNACVLSPSPAWCTQAIGNDPLDDNSDIRASTTGFLAGGGLLDVLPLDTALDPAVARAATQAFVFDDEVPETWTWSLSVQREMFNDYLVELRYVGTHAINLPIQRWLNAGIPVYFQPGNQLPVFTNMSEVPGSFPAGVTTLADLDAQLATGPLVLFPYGFTGGVITMFTPDGRSTYHGGSIRVQRRMAQGLMLDGSYTFSRTVDLIENDLFTSFLNPRRPWNMIDINDNRGLSGLHRKHKFSFAWVWDVPGYAGGNAFASKVLSGWQISGNYLAQTGQPITILAGRDLNGDFDTAGDRVFHNLNGSPGVGSDSSPVCWDGSTVSVGCTDAALIVGYVADVANAEFIRPGRFGLATAGRNSFTWWGINNWNLGVAKQTPFWTEDRYIEFGVQFINAFNHPSFALGTGSAFQRVDPFGTRAVGIPGSSTFLDKTSLSGGLGNAPFQRLIQFSLKVVF